MKSQKSGRRAYITISGLTALLGAEVFLAATLKTAPLVSSPSTPPPPTRYAVVDLGTNLFPVAINSSGVVAGNGTMGTSPNQVPLPQVWNQGTPTTLPTNNPNGTKFWTVGIDDAGHVAGQMWWINPPPAGWNPFFADSGCYWSSLTAVPQPLGVYIINFPSSGGSHLSAISKEGFMVGNATGGGAPQFNSAWVDANGFNYAQLLPTANEWAGGAQGYGAAGTGNWCGIYNYFSGPQFLQGAVVNGTVYFNYPTLALLAINESNIAVGYDGSNAEMFGANDVEVALGPGRANAINNYTNSAGVSAPQILGSDTSGNPTLWDQTALNGTNTINGVYIQKNLNSLLPGPSGTNPPPWAVTSVAAINDFGAIVGTATSSGADASIPLGTTTYTSAGTPPSAGSHGVLLLPLKLALLNGSTPDFDGSIPTTLPPASENSTYAADLQECGSATLGVQPMGQGRVNNPPPNEHYTIQTLVVANAPAAIAGIQYNWKRYISRRSWYIQKNTAGTAWTVTWRSSRGTTSPADDTGGSDFYSTAPSSAKHELYFQDTSALGYGNFPNDTASGFMKIGDYIHEEKAFLYILQTSFDGTNWTDGVNATYAQSITVQYKATGGTAATDWNGVPSLQGGNTFIQGSITPIITTAKVRAIVGGSLPINIDPNANNQ